MEALAQKSWWEYLERDLQKLFNTSYFLLDAIENWENEVGDRESEFDDYAFVVFPAAKAYEGFLKKLFLDLGFITTEDYYGKHFRIGRSLNPSLPKEIRSVGVYDKVVNYCNGKGLANTLWDTWRVTRNLTFHWFPNEKNSITLDEAKEHIVMIITALDMAFTECKVAR